MTARELQLNGMLYPLDKELWNAHIHSKSITRQLNATLETEVDRRKELVQELFGLTPIEAVRQLNSDFALGLDVDKPPDMEAVNRRRREIAERKAEKARVEHMYDVLLRYFTLLDKYKICYAPKNPDDETDRRFIYALLNIGYAEYMLETFNRYDKEQQAEIKLEVDRIEREYKRCVEEWGE